MSKGERTREMIVARAAPLFNRRGYAGVSLSAIMEATGLEKGGIYRHFGSKEELSLVAFDHNMSALAERFEAAVHSHRNAVDRLKAILEVHREVAADHVVPGGCPILNTAVEADDTDPRLAERARKGMDDWIAMVTRIVHRGIERGEIRAETDPAALASTLFAAMEGAVLMARLHPDGAQMQHVLTHLDWYLESAVRA